MHTEQSLTCDRRFNFDVFVLVISVIDKEEAKRGEKRRKAKKDLAYIPFEKGSLLPLSLWD